MSATRFNEFNEDVESWDRYLKRFNFHLSAHEVTDETKMKAVLLTVIGPKCFGLLCDLVQPEEPESKTYKQLVDLLTAHFCPKPSKFVSRVSFLAINRRKEMRMADYVALLRKASQHCMFGNMLEEFLLLQFVSGINDAEIQARLLDLGDDLTFTKALTLSTAMETSRKDGAVIRKDSEGIDVATHRVNVPRTYRQDFRSRKMGNQEQKGKRSCYRCGSMDHKSEHCVHMESICFNCRKQGHLSRVCRQSFRRRTQQNYEDTRNENSINNPKKNLHYIHGDEEEGEQRLHCVDKSDEEELEVLDLYNINSTADDRYLITVNINEVQVEMELDSGASRTIIGRETWENICKSQSCCILKPSTAKLRSFGGHISLPLGESDVKVSVENVTKIVHVIVAKTNTPNLFGRDWMSEFGYEVVRMNQLSKFANLDLDRVLKKHAAVFGPGIGCIEGYRAHIALKENSEPRFLKARPVPYALRPRVEQELLRLVEQGILVPVSTSDWAAPIVVVPKPDGTVRICGDFSQTINPVARIDQYPMPNVEDILFKIREAGGGEKTSILDVSHAFEHLGLDEQSQNYTVINTHLGLFKYTRVPYGLAAGPALFQRAIESILAKVNFAQPFIDDVMVSGRDDKHHIGMIDLVLTELEEANVKLNKQKCKFMQEEVKYLGFVVNSQGVKPARDLLDAIQTAPPPRNVSELKAYTGLLTFYGKFIPQMATKLEPLYELQRGNKSWTWGFRQQKAFESSKQWLNSEKLLYHYDPNKELIVTCDASPYGVGAVLTQSNNLGHMGRITSGSRTLTPAERKYSQLDKEALALVFALTKFHKFLYGRRFVLETDHKPLLGIFGKNKRLPDQASPRMIRWAVKLAGYDFDLVYRKGSENEVADALSRMPTLERAAGSDEFASIALLEVESSLLCQEELKRETDKDGILSFIRNALEKGIGLPDDIQYQPYKIRERQLHLEESLVLWGGRVIIPEKLRNRAMMLLHEGHPGVVKMKAIARSYIWWPKLDSEIENKVKSCIQCQITRHAPPKEMPQPWPSPRGPWTRVHLDHAGPYHGQIFLIAVDAYSKWIEVKRVSSTSMERTVEAVRDMFACHGLPDLVVTDNGTSFKGYLFQNFLKKNGVNQLFAPPYHPQSNGAAERVVQTVKNDLSHLQEKDWAVKLARALFRYRSRPHATTGVSPAELLMGRKLTTHIDRICKSKENQASKLSPKKDLAFQQQKLPIRSFVPGDPIWIKGFVNQPKWMSAIVNHRLGKVMYSTTLTGGVQATRHVNQMRPRASALINEPGRATVILPSAEKEKDIVPTLVPPSPSMSTAGLKLSDPIISNDTQMSDPAIQVSPVLRRSSRIIRAPDRLDL